MFTILTQELCRSQGELDRLPKNFAWSCNSVKIIDNYFTPIFAYIV